MNNTEQLLPPGLAEGATQKEIDAAGAAIMRKPGHLLSQDEIKFVHAEALRVMREQ